MKFAKCTVIGLYAALLVTSSLHAQAPDRTTWAGGYRPAREAAAPIPLVTTVEKSYSIDRRIEAFVGLKKSEGIDWDEDGFGSNDNCPIVSNRDQSDRDRDGHGDACDNCDEIPNAAQNNWDGDEEGDACDDSDGDGVNDIRDNCIETSNDDQEDQNGDDIGDACDDECLNPPELMVEVTESVCRWHRADECDKHFFWEGSCDRGFDEGQMVVTSSEYAIRWESRYVDRITDDCRDIDENVDYERDSGEVTFEWDGPWGGLYRTGGRRECVIIGHGRCGQTVRAGYWYSCED